MQLDDPGEDPASIVARLQNALAHNMPPPERPVDQRSVDELLAFIGPVSAPSQGMSSGKKKHNKETLEERRLRQIRKCLGKHQNTVNTKKESKPK